jgi:hypothetical protein
MSSPFTSSPRYLGIIVADKWGDISVDCTFSRRISFNPEFVKFIMKESFECVAPSCVSEWESGEGQMSDEYVKGMESSISKRYSVYNLECKINNASAESFISLVDSSVGAGDGSSSAGEDTTGDGAGEGSSVGAGSSSAGEPTGAGEGNCIADAIYGASPAFNDALKACGSETVVGEFGSETVVGDTTITYDYSACPLSHLTEACAADNRKLHCRS